MKGTFGGGGVSGDGVLLTGSQCGQRREGGALTHGGIPLLCLQLGRGGEELLGSGEGSGHSVI